MNDKGGYKFELPKRIVQAMESIAGLKPMPRNLDQVEYKTNHPLAVGGVWPCDCSHICEKCMAQNERFEKQKPRYCYWYSYPGLNRWLALYMHEFKQEHVGIMIVRGWVSKFIGCDYNSVEVLRMKSFDRIPDFR